MSRSSALRLEIESALARRVPSALTPQPERVRPLAPTGIASIDSLLGGGLPVGAISEIVGPECSGRTSLALSFLSSITAAGQVCAWIDATDALDPESAAAAGVDLSRLLWVRCGAAPDVVLPPNAGGNSSVKQPAMELQQRPTGGGGSPHPRNEVRGLDMAVEEMMRRKNHFVRDKRIGTPAMRNLSLGARQVAASSELAGKRIERMEQIPCDRLPARRGDHVLKSAERYQAACAEPQRRSPAVKQPYQTVAPSGTGLGAKPAAPHKPWTRLDQALRATDLLLHAGGFGAVVLDLGSTSPEHAVRIPLATWFRYRAAVSRASISLVLLTQHPCTKSSAGVVLKLLPVREIDGVPNVLNGLHYTAELLRQRFAAPVTQHRNVVTMRKGPQPERGAHWDAAMTWTTPACEEA